MAPPLPLSGLEGIFSSVVGAVLGFAGIVLFAMLVMGGIKWITAGGDPQRLQSAKGTVTFAIYGFVFTALAYLILVLIATFTGAEGLRTFRIVR